jgi:hypothetical protein
MPFSETGKRKKLDHGNAACQGFAEIPGHGGVFPFATYTVRVTDTTILIIQFLSSAFSAVLSYCSSFE